MTAKKTPDKAASPAAPAKTTAKSPREKKVAGKAATSKTLAEKSTSLTAKAAAGSKHPTGTKATSGRATATAKAPSSKSRLAVRDGERPWTANQIAEVKETLDFDATRLRAEIAAAEQEIGQLLREGGEGAGNDQADVGSNTFERDHEMSMVKNARENLELVEAAIERISAGSYGLCESCELPIGKLRLQAFPRATLCMECKQRQERR